MGETKEVVINFVEDLHATELFATEAIGFFRDQGNISITLASARLSHASDPGPINRVVIARIVMPIEGTQGFAAGLYDFLCKQGLEPVPRPDKHKLQ